MATPGGAEGEDGAGVAQVELEGVWGFETDTELRSVAELQKQDDEVMAIGRSVTARSYRTFKWSHQRVRRCASICHGINVRELCRIWERKGEPIWQLYIPLTMRGRLVVTKHVLNLVQAPSSLH